MWAIAKLVFTYTDLRETTSSINQETGLAYGEDLSITMSPVP